MADTAVDRIELAADKGSPESQQISDAKEGRDRDAWATIRGFVYQVDLTILRWLQLNDVDELELERGEDIDLVAKALEGDLGGCSRRVEQVKVRESRISLKSPEACEALANFHSHRSGASTLRSSGIVFFLLTTTAEVARERQSPMPQKQAGIEAWQEIRAHEYPDADLDAGLAGLRSLMLGGSRPQNYPEAKWNNYFDWIRLATTADLLIFIQEFEWATGALDADGTAERVRSELRREVGAGAPQVEALYAQLFHMVFRALTRRGPKRLSRGLLIDAIQLANNREIPAIFQQIELLRAELTDQLHAMTDDIASVRALSEATATQVLALTMNPNPLTTPNFSSSAGAALCMTDPVAPIRRSNRCDTVLALLAIPQPPPVISLYGTAHCGKTQLALLLASELGERRAWFRFRDRSPDRAADILHSGVVTLAQSSSADPSANPWRELCAKAALAAEVFVFDDIPRFRAGDEFGSIFLPLVQILGEHNKPVVTMSNSPLAPLCEILPDRRHLNRQVPSFSRPEARDIMDHYFGPTRTVSEFAVNLATSLTSGHPALLHAFAAFVAASGSFSDDDVFDQLLRRTFAEPLNASTCAELLDTISDVGARELLYRLTTIQGDFAISDVQILANVSPALVSPRERLAPLIGAWVAPQESGRFSLSPLSTSLGDADLAPDVRRSCHIALANQILARKRINQDDAERVMLHFVHAEDFEGAGKMFARLLFALLQEPVEVIRRATALKIWDEMPLPVAMSPTLQLQIRSLQAVLFRRVGATLDRVTTHIRALLGVAGIDRGVAFVAASVVVVDQCLTDCGVAAPLVGGMLHDWPHVRSRLGAAAEESEKEFKIVGLVWMVAASIRKAQDVRAWSSMLASLPADMQVQVLAHEFATDAISVIATLPVLWEFDLARSAKDWGRAVNLLQELWICAEVIESSDFKAAISAARISCSVEQGMDFAELSAEAESLIGYLAGAPDSQFRVAKTIALAAIDHRLPVVAEKWLQTADECLGNQHMPNRVRVRLLRAATFANNDPARCAALMESAWKLTCSERPQIRRTANLGFLAAQVAGELALARWRTGDRHGAGAALLDMVDSLYLDEERNDPDWRSLVVIAGHLSGYLYSQIIFAAPPANLSNGEAYADPKQGMLTTPSPIAAELFSNERLAILGLHACNVAEAIGSEDMAEKWATRAGKRLKALRLWQPAASAFRVLILSELRTQRYDAAIDHAIDFAASFVVRRGQPRDAMDLMRPTERPRSIVGERPLGGQNGQWGQIDDLAALLVVFPAFCNATAVLRRNPDAGLASAQTLVHACRSQSAQPGLPEDGTVGDFWLEAARVIEGALIVPIGFQRLHELAKCYHSRGSDAFACLQGLAYLGASFDPKTSIENRARAHKVVADFVNTRAAILESSYDRVVTPFFLDFWEDAFAANRFQFVNPNEIAIRLAHARAAPANERLNRTMEAISRGLRIRSDSTAHS